MKKNVTIAVLMSLLTCVACADKSSSSASLAYAPQQYSSANWNEMMASSDQIAAPATPLRQLLR